MINQSIPTDWIRDIEPDPRFVKRMADAITDAIDDDLTAFCWDIATDYVSAPEDYTDEFEDEFCDKVISPLYDKILKAIFENLTGDDDDTD